MEIKDKAKNLKNKLSRKNIRMCIWILYQRCKGVLGWHEIYLNIEDENNYLDEYLKFKKLNSKGKNIHLTIRNRFNIIIFLSKDNNIK